MKSAMEHKRIQVGLKLPPELIGEIDQVRKSMDFAPDRTAVIERAIKEWLAKHSRKSAKAA